MADKVREKPPHEWLDAKYKEWRESDYDEGFQEWLATELWHMTKEASDWERAAWYWRNAYDERGRHG